MIYETIENTPVTIDFQEMLNDRSWVLSGNKATHYPCNANSPLKLISYPVEPNINYNVSFKITQANNSPQLQLGFATPLFTYTTAQNVNVTLNTPLANQRLTFWGNGFLELEVINIQREGEQPSTQGQYTPVWSESNNRWVDFRSYRPENGFSMFTDLFTYRNGQLWIHKGNSNYDNFYGQQFQTTVNFPVGTNFVKTWQSVAIHSNNIMVTTTDGITTQLGQVSDLIETDFNSREGIHYANFLRDKLTGLIEGSRLKGRYITLHLTTVDGSQKLQIFKVVTKFQQSTPNE